MLTILFFLSNFLLTQGLLSDFYFEYPNGYVPDVDSIGSTHDVTVVEPNEYLDGVFSTPVLYWSDYLDKFKTDNTFYGFILDDYNYVQKVLLRKTSKFRGNFGGFTYNSTLRYIEKKPTSSMKRVYLYDTFGYQEGYSRANIGNHCIFDTTGISDVQALCNDIPKCAGFTPGCLVGYTVLDEAVVSGSDYYEKIVVPPSVDFFYNYWYMIIIIVGVSIGIEIIWEWYIFPADEIDTINVNIRK